MYIKGRKNYMKYENKLLLIQLLNVKISRKSDKEVMTSGEFCENKWFYMKYIHVRKYLSVKILLTHENYHLQKLYDYNPVGIYIIHKFY